MPLRANTCCHIPVRLYTRPVRFVWKIAAGFAGLLLVLGCTGCGGINTQGTVSPATFLLPGLLRAEPESPPSVDSALPSTPPLTVAQAR